jgi:hypothetical protein
VQRIGKTGRDKTIHPEQKIGIARARVKADKFLEMQRKEV